MAERIFNNDRLRLSEKALFIMLVILGLSVFTDAIGAEDILGAFLAGLCLNKALQHSHALSEHVQFAGRMLFIPFFFISTGMQLNIGVFTGSADTLLIAALLILLVIVGKSLAAWIMGHHFGYGSEERILIIGMTIPQAAATLAIAAAAREGGLFQEQEFDAVIVMIFATSLVGPLISKWIGRKMIKAAAP